MNRRFYFSVDLEEFSTRHGSPFHKTPLPELTARYLELLRRHGAHCTFFIVGEIAEKFPGLIRDIAGEGHELACHTHTHLPLSRHDARSLREDLLRNLDAIGRCANGGKIEGFRAPILSLTRETGWAHEVLAGLGFTYSSSVLPAANPLHGWPGFGNAPRRVDGILEIPITLVRIGPLRVPVGAGTYFRCLPFPLVRRAFERLAARGEPVVGYFHPYDIDAAQERVMSAGVRGSRLLNSLLYVNRHRAFARIEALLDRGFIIEPCRNLAARV